MREPSIGIALCLSDIDLVLAKVWPFDLAQDILGGAA